MNVCYVKHLKPRENIKYNFFLTQKYQGGNKNKRPKCPLQSPGQVLECRYTVTTNVIAMTNNDLLGGLLL